MTRKEYAAMCAESADPSALLKALWDAKAKHGMKSDQYFDAFVALWEDRIPHLSDYQIESIKEVAKPHTQITSALPHMAWLYDRLLAIDVYPQPA